jgi:hypothetical protein
MLSNQKSSRSSRVKAAAFLVIALALLMNVTAFASGNSRFAFIDTAAEFFGLQSNNAAVTMNAAPASSTQIRISSAAFADVSVTLPTVNPASPGALTVPVTVSAITVTENVLSYDFNVDYDPTVIRPVSAAGAVDSAGTMSSPMLMTANVYGCSDATPGGCTNGPGMGHLTISGFAANAITGPAGTLTNLKFVVQTIPGGFTTMNFADYTDITSAFHPAFIFNEGDPLANPITNGSVNVPFATPTFTNTPTPSATNTSTATNTATATNTVTPSNTATNTNTPTPSNTSTPTATATNTPLCAQVDIDDKTVSSGDPVTISVMTSDMTSPPQVATFSADMHISYDTTVLATAPGPFYGVSLGPVGLSNSSTLTVNRTVSGSTATLLISVFSSSTPMSGAGSLVDIAFPSATGPAGTFSPIYFTPFSLNGIPINQGFWYNEGSPASCVQDGSVSISGQVGGQVLYGNSQGAPSIRPVPNTLITGNGSPVVSDTTDTGGFYAITGFGSGSYTMVPSRSSATLPDTHGSSISAYDAGRTAQYVVGLVPFNSTQIRVAKVTGDTTVSSRDASMMALWAVSLPGTGLTGNWVFLPSSVTHLFVMNPTDDYSALLMGDVSGNWCDPTSPALPCNITGTNGGSRSAGGPTRAIAVTAEKQIARAGSDVTVPVTVAGVENKGLISYQFDLRYDPSVIQPKANAVTLADTVSSEMSVVVNSTTPGVLRVAVFGPYALANGGTLLNFHFTAVGAPFSVSPIRWESFMFNEGAFRTSVVDSQVELSAAAPNTAADDR